MKQQSRLREHSPTRQYAFPSRLSRYKVSQRARSDAMLLAEIRAPLAASRGIYGAPRIHAELAAKGIRVGRKRIPRLMSQAGVVGASRRKFVMTAKDGSRPAPDLVDRNFRVDQPNRLSPTSLTFRPGRAFSISPLCSMH